MADINERIQRYDRDTLFGLWHLKGGSPEKAFLGSGSFSRVYEVYYEEQERNGHKTRYEAAVKLIPIEESSTLRDRDRQRSPSEKRERLNRELDIVRREIRIMKRLDGESNIAYFQDSVIIERRDQALPAWDVLIRMEKLVPLKKYLMDRNLLGYSREMLRCVLYIWKEICAALRVCERNQILHTDVKPDNVFYAPGTDHFKLSDFGTSMEKAQFDPGVYRGTLDYMSPEMYHREGGDSRTDMYSLAVMVYELLNEGQLPLQSEKTRDGRKSAMLARLDKLTPVPPLRQVPREINDVLCRCLDKDPAQRYPDFARLSDVITSLYLKYGAGSIEPGSKKKLRPWMLIAGALGVCVVGSIVVVSALNTDTPVVVDQPPAIMAGSTGNDVITPELAAGITTEPPTVPTDTPIAEALDKSTQLPADTTTPQAYAVLKLSVKGETSEDIKSASISGIVDITEGEVADASTLEFYAGNTLITDCVFAREADRRYSLEARIDLPERGSLMMLKVKDTASGAEAEAEYNIDRSRKADTSTPAPEPQPIIELRLDRTSIEGEPGSSARITGEIELTQGELPNLSVALGLFVDGKGVPMSLEALQGNNYAFSAAVTLPEEDKDVTLRVQTWDGSVSDEASFSYIAPTPTPVPVIELSLMEDGITAEPASIATISGIITVTQGDISDRLNELKVIVDGNEWERASLVPMSDGGFFFKAQGQLPMEAKQLTVSVRDGYGINARAEIPFATPTPSIELRLEEMSIKGEPGALGTIHGTIAVTQGELSDPSSELKMFVDEDAWQMSINPLSDNMFAFSAEGTLPAQSTKATVRVQNRDESINAEASFNYYAFVAVIEPEISLSLTEDSITAEPGSIATISGIVTVTQGEIKEPSGELSVYVDGIQWARKPFTELSDNSYSFEAQGQLPREAKNLTVLVTNKDESIGAQAQLSFTLPEPEPSFAPLTIRKPVDGTKTNSSSVILNAEGEPRQDVTILLNGEPYGINVMPTSSGLISTAVTLSKRGENEITLVYANPSATTDNKPVSVTIDYSSTERSLDMGDSIYSNTLDLSEFSWIKTAKIKTSAGKTVTMQGRSIDLASLKLNYGDKLTLTAEDSYGNAATKTLVFKGASPELSMDGVALADMPIPDVPYKDGAGLSINAPAGMNLRVYVAEKENQAKMESFDLKLTKGDNKIKLRSKGAKSDGKTLCLNEGDNVLRLWVCDDDWNPIDGTECVKLELPFDSIPPKLEIEQPGPGDTSVSFEISDAYSGWTVQGSVDGKKAFNPYKSEKKNEGLSASLDDSLTSNSKYEIVVTDSAGNETRDYVHLKDLQPITIKYQDELSGAFIGPEHVGTLQSILSDVRAQEGYTTIIRLNGKSLKGSIQESDLKDGENTLTIEYGANQNLSEEAIASTRLALSFNYDGAIYMDQLVEFDSVSSISGEPGEKLILNEPPKLYHTSNVSIELQLRNEAGTNYSVEDVRSNERIVGDGYVLGNVKLHKGSGNRCETITAFTIPEDTPEGDYDLILNGQVIGEVRVESKRATMTAYVQTSPKDMGRVPAGEALIIDDCRFVGYSDDVKNANYSFLQNGKELAAADNNAETLVKLDSSAYDALVAQIEGEGLVLIDTDYADNAYSLESLKIPENLTPGDYELQVCIMTDHGEVRQKLGTLKVTEGIKRQNSSASMMGEVVTSSEKHIAIGLDAPAQDSFNTDGVVLTGWIYREGGNATIDGWKCEIKGEEKQDVKFDLISRKNVAALAPASVKSADAVAKTDNAGFVVRIGSNAFFGVTKSAELTLKLIVDGEEFELKPKLTFDRKAEPMPLDDSYFEAIKQSWKPSDTQQS